MCMKFTFPLFPLQGRVVFPITSSQDFYRSMQTVMRWFCLTSLELNSSIKCFQISLFSFPEKLRFWRYMDLTGQRRYFLPKFQKWTSILQWFCGIHTALHTVYSLIPSKTETMSSSAFIHFCDSWAIDLQIFMVVCSPKTWELVNIFVLSVPSSRSRYVFWTGLWFDAWIKVCGYHKLENF